MKTNYSYSHLFTYIFTYIYMYIHIYLVLLKFKPTIDQQKSAGLPHNKNINCNQQINQIIIQPTIQSTSQPIKHIKTI